MKARRPSFGPAIKALQSFKAFYTSKLSPVQQETITEVAQRLRRLENEVGRLMALNNRFIERRLPKVEFDPNTDIVTYRVGAVEQKVKLKRADPNVPISMRQVTAGAAYKANAISTKELGLSEKERHEFEGLLEQYYYNAHKVLDLIKTLPGLDNFRCREVTIVRNKLVEHPLVGEVYSFGFGTSGPVIRPMQKAGREWHDEGLVPNSESFIQRLVAALNRR